ncbi:hypothetical protein BV372_25470 [Nostoc sp. T09]|uniref:hypothetical protein n=1 Tax=Nostoc sp. T09 TaxID=1932621 RepID=UPI000A36E99C|nr:hypothetical protein [Nostoc sp. T09]OUL27663.1 hypothetical protein BV372_25470 [Nostoc sp. T09]
MDIEFQNCLQHFTALKSKYQANKYEDSSPSSPLYLILRKADIGIKISDLELQWLSTNQLIETINILKQQQKDRAKELSSLEVEFYRLKSKFKAKKHDVSWQSSNLYFILAKLDSGITLSDNDSNWLVSSGLFEVKEVAQEIEQFTQLKTKYKATQSKESNIENLLYHILEKIDTSQNLIDSEYEWLINKNLLITAEIYNKQELAKEDKFAQLQVKYKATQYPEKSIYNPLYPILQKLDADEKLIYTEFNWLEKQGLIETIAIAQKLEQIREFTILKVKYKATQYNDSSPKSHLYKILTRLEVVNQLSEQDINFLKKRKLTETIEIANEKYAFTLKSKIDSGEFLNDSEIAWLKNNRRKDIITLAQQKHFAVLKRKYGLIEPKLPMEPFYTIMVKLEKKERLDPLLVIQFIEQNLLSREGKIALAHYKLEAEFYEQELQRTGHKWNIPNASSYWRKANEPEQALKITNLDLGKIKNSNLKSAILVTRGAAFRDIDNLFYAEKCAIAAIDCHPDSYQPYTLMGAIAYDNGDYPKGDYWFEQAIKRGAKTEDIDDEIKRVLNSTKDDEKRHEAANYLLKKDSHRYSWAKSYLKKPKNEC